MLFSVLVSWDGSWFICTGGGEGCVLHETNQKYKNETLVCIVGIVGAAIADQVTILKHKLLGFQKEPPPRIPHRDFADIVECLNVAPSHIGPPPKCYLD